MDLNLLGLFVDIAESPSLSAAARRLGVTRSHVSQRLQALERQLGVQLVRRTTRRLELTEAGRTVYEHGLRIRREADAVTSAVEALSGETVGSVRLSVPTGLGRLVVAPLLLAFGREYGRVGLSVRFSNRIDDLVAAQIDVALKVASTTPQDYVARDLGRVRWLLCASHAYLSGRPPIRDATDLAVHRFVCPPTGGARLTLQTDRSVIVTAPPRVQSEDFCFLLDAVQAGLGIGLLPSYMVERALADDTLCVLLPDVPIENAGERLFLLTMQNPYPSPAQKTLVNFLAMSLKTVLI